MDEFEKGLKSKGFNNSQTEFEKIFQTMTSIILGRKLSGYLDYEEWLSKNVSNIETIKSAISDEPVYIPQQFEFYQDVKPKIVTINEAYEKLGKNQLSESELRKLSLKNASIVLQNISMTTMDTQYGKNVSVEQSSLYYESHVCLKGTGLVYSKYSLFSFWPRQSEYTMGCYYLFSSKFCIRCFNSENLNRCFEVSDSNNCSDCYFCYNCENLNDCMFCFNVKSKRYAIANVEVGKENYMKIKKMFLEELAKRLEKEKKLDFSIFSLAD
ncbi:hypothetical protein HY988_03625 [Candidatus Micrarchaeota archaeon]|nr:hypothetical protein [Candidatus Micrarchaeota archaeon]